MHSFVNRSFEESAITTNFANFQITASSIVKPGLEKQRVFQLTVAHVIRLASSEQYPNAFNIQIQISTDGGVLQSRWIRVASVNLV